MWDALAGPFLAVAGLLVVAGVPKVIDPLPLVRALRSAGFVVPPGPGAALVRLFAVGEVVVGVWAVVAPGRASAALVAAAYLVFTLFVGRVLTRGGVLGSCGCFGKPDTPATRTHLVLTAAAALVAVALAADPPSAVWSGAAANAPAGASIVTTVALAVVIAGLAWMVMAVLPTTTATAVRSANPTRTKG
ncbi:MauE/DoxX family redox-associated membrane protein [Phycicoccus sp. Root101]|uniref:MauE/DoxX family redox-associated membrane protein n=1 Tax=Phycicoccus sp. Root101 TaxID=1736421 RepID=UPI000702623D|nr:MauE/DoxX family redox-associated membrane protein [Phycicoccus sp. Root101]KQU68248.1 hypothetical protein ASC58_11895 [Phycicoccus sp. Root101]